MPSTERQRTARDSSKDNRADDEHSGSDSPKPHKIARKRSDEKADDGNTSATKRANSPVDYVGLTPHTGCSGGFSVRLKRFPIRR